LEDISNAITQYAMLLTFMIIVVMSIYLVFRIMFEAKLDLL
jgi:hypothetical protein